MGLYIMRFTLFIFAVGLFAQQQQQKSMPISPEDFKARLDRLKKAGDYHSKIGPVMDTIKAQQEKREKEMKDCELLIPNGVIKLVDGKSVCVAQ